MMILVAALGTNPVLCISAGDLRKSVLEWFETVWALYVLLSELLTVNFRAFLV